MHPWLRELHHDLVKRVLWPARDQRDLGGRDVQALRRGLTELADAEGAPATAEELWRSLRAQAPAPAGALDAFEGALKRAVASLNKPWPAPLDAVLALEPAFDALRKAVPEK